MFFLTLKNFTETGVDKPRPQGIYLQQNKPLSKGK